MKKFRSLSEELTPSSKPEPGREAVGGRFQSSAAKRPSKPAPIVTSEENISEIVMPQVKGDLGILDRTSFVKKHGVTKSVAKQRLATEAKEKTEYDYEGDMARGQLQSVINNAQRVHDMLEDNDNLPEWVQSKITLAEDYISTVANYMMGELDEAKEVGDVPSGDVNSPNLTVKKGKTVAAGPVTEATSAAVRMQRALDKIKQSREASERRAQELLKPKQPVQKEEVELEEDVSKMSTDKLKQHWDKHKDQSGASPVFAAQLRKVGKELAKRKALRKEEVEQIDELKSSTLINYLQKVHDDSLKHNMDPTKRSAEKRNRSVTGFSRAFNKLETRKEEVEHLEEGRPSQRHPLEGHEYHKKSDEALIHIAKDAHAAAEAMKGHNTTAENKYRDQANDSATVRHFRKTSGMPDWYKKKYGHMKESFRPMDEPNMNLSIQARQKKADDNKLPFDGPYKKSTGVVTDKSGAKHGPMSVARNLARQALKKQASKMSVKESLEESRKAEIVKEIMKKGKKKEDNTFQAEPELGSTVVKADN